MIYCSHSERLIHPQVGGGGRDTGEREDRGNGNVFFWAMVIYAAHGGPRYPKGGHKTMDEERLLGCQGGWGALW